MVILRPKEKPELVHFMRLIKNEVDIALQFY